MTWDLVVRGGTIVDGTGAPPITADVAVAGGRVVEVGQIDGRAVKEIDADGALVAPGFVDIHTHYDGQVAWDERLQPSSGLGVTTVVMGNCGVGFAPVHDIDHEKLIELMEGVEDLPGTVLHEGLPWTWESFADYLDSVERLPHDIDFAAQVCHGPLRLYVMGQRGADREPATEGEIAEMGRLAAQAVRAGALGFTTSRTLNHRTSRGEPTPTLTAAREELVGIATSIGATGAGVLQVISDFPDFENESGTLLEMMRASGRPLSVSLAQSAPGDGYRRILSLIESANDEGLKMRGQVAARAIGVMIGLEATLNPLVSSATYRSLEPLPLADRVVRLGDAEVKKAVLEEAKMRWPFESLFELGDPPDYEPDRSQSIATRAQSAGLPPRDFLYDLLLGAGGTALLYMPVLNYGDGNLNAVGEMLSHRFCVPGLGDGGAHVGTICDASFPTFLLCHWAREGRFSLEWLVERQCRATATAVGLLDRGVLAPGYKADMNVIDLDGLQLHPPVIVHDLPGGGKRLMQEASGYLHTIVSGVETYTGGKPTGELPGQLIRGAQTCP